MHTHISGLTFLYMFLGIILVGLLWRLGAAKASRQPGLIGELGKAAAVMY